MELGISLGLTRLGNVGFSPASLFTGGVQGAWYDPSDFSTMYQTNDTSTPVTAVGQSVGRIQDKSGRGNHATQSNAGLRPILRQDADGKFYLEFGSSRWLRAAFSIPQPFERITAIRQNTWTANSRILAGAAANNGNFSQFSPSPGLAISSSVSIQMGGGAVLGVNAIITERFNGVTSRAAINDSAYATGDVGSGVTDGITIGGASSALGSGFSADVRYYGGIAIARTLTTNEIANTRAFLAAKANIASPSIFSASSAFATVNGVRRYSYQSSYVDSASSAPFANALDVLLPDAYDPGNTYPLVVVLGVEPFVSFYADELQVIKTAGLQNTTGASGTIFVRLNTRSSPWWGCKDDGTVNYEALVRDGVLPWVRANFPIVAGRQGVSLLGYSKGGFGAFSLILRNPTQFGYAASWDAPLTSAYGAGANGLAEAFGSSAQYNLFLPSNILAANKAAINDKARTVNAGYNLFQSEVDTFEAQLVSESVPHTYLSVLRASHNADSGWMPSVVAALAALW